MSMNTDGKKVTDDAIEWFKKENARLKEEVAHLKHLLSEEPDFRGSPAPEFQRVWEACIGLSEKSDFKFMFGLMHKMEQDLKGQDKMIERLKWALLCHHWNSDCQCILMGVTPEETMKKPEAP